MKRRFQSRMNIDDSLEGETIEVKMERILANKEKIPADAPLIHTERKDGVKAAYNPRTDRFEIALEATEKIEKSFTSRREERHKPKLDVVKISGAEPTQGNAETK